jgi:hypothetical protein
VVATAPLPIEAFPVGVSDDRLVVAAAGRIYTIDTGGNIADLGAGSPITAGNGYVVIARCDEQLSCGWVRVDLATSEETELPKLEDVGGGRACFGCLGGGVGPSGAVLVWSLEPGGSPLFLVDSGGARPFGDHRVVRGPSRASFSADGRWVLVTGAGEAWIGPATGASGVLVDLPSRYANDQVWLLQGPVA